MNCSQVHELISQYVDGMLVGHARRAVEAHLRGCPDCRKELESLRTLVAAAGQVASIEPPVDLRARIAAATTQTRPNVALRWLHGIVPARTMQWAAGAAAAAFIVIGLVINTGQAPNELPQPRIVQSSQSEQATEVVVTQQPSVERTTPKVRTEHASVMPARKTTHLPPAQTEVAEVAMARSMRKPMPLPKVSDLPVKRAEETVVADVHTVQLEEKVRPERNVVSTPPPPARKKSPNPKRDTLVKVAVVPPAVSSDNGEWIRQMRTLPVMHTPDSGNTGMRDN